MPEFAELNKQVRWLRERVVGWQVDAYGSEGWGNFPALKDNPSKDQILDQFFKGAVIESVTQRGKFAVFRLSTGTMFSHLMFKGRWSIAGDDFLSNYKQHKNKPTEKSVTFWLSAGGKKLNFHEPEYKGKVHAFLGKQPKDCEELSSLGPEIKLTRETDPDFAAQDWQLSAFVANLGKTKKSVKELLLDQKKQAGLGNMYVCEALYRAGVRPDRASNSLSADEARAIYEAAREVVQQSIDTELDYKTVLAVYNRDTDPEGHPVEVSEVGGRDTYWVPAKQH
jgi:formamidopyrimidine-DNA glycosylase